MVPTLGQAPLTTTPRTLAAATPTPPPATTSRPASLEATLTTPAVQPPQAQDLPTSSVQSQAARRQRLEAVTIPHRLQAAQALMGELGKAQALVCQVLACQQILLCQALQRCRSTLQVERWFPECHLGFL